MNQNTDQGHFSQKLPQIYLYVNLKIITFLGEKKTQDLCDLGFDEQFFVTTPEAQSMKEKLLLDFFKWKAKDIVMGKKRQATGRENNLCKVHVR